MDEVTSSYIELLETLMELSEVNDKTSVVSSREFPYIWSIQTKTNSLNIVNSAIFFSNKMDKITVTRMDETASSIVVDIVYDKNNIAKKIREFLPEAFKKEKDDNKK
jgi:hypothetical protein